MDLRPTEHRRRRNEREYYRQNAPRCFRFQTILGTQICLPRSWFGSLSSRQSILCRGLVHNGFDALRYRQNAPPRLCPWLVTVFPPASSWSISTLARIWAVAPSRALKQAFLQPAGEDQGSRAEPGGTDSAHDPSLHYCFPLLQLQGVPAVGCSGPPKFERFAGVLPHGHRCSKGRRSDVAAGQEDGFNPCIEAATLRLAAVCHAGRHGS